MRLVIPHGQAENVAKVVDPATPQAIRDEFNPPEWWYGAGIDLHASTGEVLACTAATGPFMMPGDEGECYLAWEDAGGVRTLDQPLTRAATIALFLRFLAGDTGFLDELPWGEWRGDAFGAGAGA